MAGKAVALAASGTATAADAVAKGAATAADAAAKGAATAADAAAKKAATAADAAAKVAPVTSAAAASASSKGLSVAEKGASTAKAAAMQVAHTVEDEARASAFILINKGIDRAMPKLTEYVKKELVDPDMPTSVVRGLDAIVDASMVEVRDILRETLTETVLKKTKDEKIRAPPRSCCVGGVCAPCKCLRAKILYTLFPHDRSIWSQMRNPWWWLLMLIGVFPLWGVRILWWCFVFAIKDRTDDYQLCTFVITFKASLFIAGGLQSAFLGTALSQACLEADNCETTAAGSNPPGFEFGLIGALVQSVCCWLAMACLPWASPRGGRLYELPAGLFRHTQPASLAKTKGGRLWYFMLYDTLILAACVGGGAYAWFGTNEPDYIVRSRVFHIRMLYSTLAFPWLLLKLPLAYTLVLHLKPTGYNRAGEVVRMCNSKERRIARNERLGDRKAVSPSPSIDPKSDMEA